MLEATVAYIFFRPILSKGSGLARQSQQPGNVRQIQVQVGFAYVTSGNFLYKIDVSIREKW